MELNTRCPECSTVFAASLEQMKLRKGYIRCVNCGNIFDGFDAVVPAALTTDATIDPASEVASSSVSFPSSASALSSSRIPPRIDLQALDDEEAYQEDMQRAAGDEEPMSLYVEPRHDRVRRSAGAEFLTHRRDTRSGWGGLVALLVIVAVLAGSALLVYAYRVQIASSTPSVRPWLEKACEPLGCAVPYPQRIDRISIMDSSLQAGSSQATMQLAVVMRNTYDKAQQWPILMLDLVDFSGAVVAAREFSPQTYLSQSDQGKPFRPGQEIRLQMPVEVEGLKVNGYQLRKYFPSKDQND